MSITYKTTTGDTFAIVAKKKYGSEEFASLISNSNPGLKEPFTSDIEINIPGQPDSPQNILQNTIAENKDEVALLINEKRFRFWEAVRILRSVDSIDTITFGAPFDSKLLEFREAFRPFTYNKVVFTVGGDPLFTGVLLPSPPLLDTKKTIVLNGYSNPGVLNDCTMPASSYPIEFNNQGLKDIAANMAAPFGLSVDFQAEPGNVFERIDVKTDSKVLPFLAGLAKQRSVVISSTEIGKLLFWKSIETGVPVAKLKQGESPVISITPTFDSQEYYSHVTGIEPAIVGLSGSQFTVKNSLLKGVIRPITFTAQDTLEADIKKAVQSKIGRMFGNMAFYSVAVDTWRDPSGNLWKPNTILSLLAPDAMIYNEYDFLIRSIEFEKSDRIKTAVLNVVMPGAFSGKIPKVLPWAE